MRTATPPRRYTTTTWEDERTAESVRIALRRAVFFCLLATIVVLSVKLIDARHELRKERGEIANRD